jgi:hypothetical protein
MYLCFGIIYGDMSCVLMSSDVMTSDLLRRLWHIGEHTSRKLKATQHCDQV